MFKRTLNSGLPDELLDDEALYEWLPTQSLKSRKKRLIGRSSVDFSLF